MGMRVFDDDGTEHRCSCWTCGTKPSTKTNSSKQGEQRQSAELVGNGKEFRIENNERDLRIVGNGNRIRIGHNMGSIHIVGNATRLKISHNAAHINYVGNEGRIYLGDQSSQQLVDYTGCNGVLKIVDGLTMKGDKYKPPPPKTVSTSPAWHKEASGSDGTKARWQQFDAAFQAPRTHVNLAHSCSSIIISNSSNISIRVK